MKIDKLGWIIAAGMTGALVMSGFQGAGLKFASVDVEKVFTLSNLTKEDVQELRQFGQKRFEVIRFLETNSAMAPSDTQTYSDLTLLAKPSDADTQKLAGITNAATADSQKQASLATKASPTTDDQRQLSDYHSRATVNKDFAQKLGNTFDAQIREKQAALKNDALDKVRKTISEIARKQGYSIVFNVDAAPFAANNLTEEVLKEVNKS